MRKSCIWTLIHCFSGLPTTQNFDTASSQNFGHVRLCEDALSAFVGSCLQIRDDWLLQLACMSTMLVSSKIFRYAMTKEAEKDWRIVIILDESASILSFFQAIVDHTYDSTEPLSVSRTAHPHSLEARVCCSSASWEG